MLRLVTLLFCFFISFVSFCQFQDKTDTILIQKLLSEYPNKFGQILCDPDFYRVQILYTQVDRSSENIIFKHYSFRLKPKEYFYPASIVKLPIVIFSLEKINRMKSEGISLDTRLAIDSSHACQRSVQYDYTTLDSFPTIGNYIKKALVVSDNDAYNRLYEFTGQSYMNNWLFSNGYTDARIVHRFSNCDSVDNKFTNGFVFYNTEGKVIGYQAPVQSTATYSTPFPDMKAGEKIISGKEIIEGSKDFSRKNCMPLGYLHEMLLKIFFPNQFSPWEQFKISGNDMEFLKTLMSVYPKESGISEYSDKKKYWDAYTKYLYYGNEAGSAINPDLKIFNKVGLSYGFASDCAYFSDVTHQIDFFLSAVIYANADGVIGDDKYDYSTIAMPFMKELGKVIYEYELSRKK